MIKGIGVDLERENESAMVRGLENNVAELLETCEDLTHQTAAIESIVQIYQPTAELTDFKKLLETEFLQLKAAASSDSQKHQLMRQFREALWNVHHGGQPMPGEEQEEVVMTSTQSTVLNITCPVTGKPITELVEPVRCVDCKHIYEKKAIMLHISKSPQAKCPIAGCPKIVRANKLVSDPVLLIEIEEMRSRSKENGKANEVEDFTELDHEGEDG